MARQSLELARLFYTVEADTKGFQRDLDAAQRSAIRFTDYITAHPVVALGALGAALVGVAVEATKMAAEVDTAVRRIGASLPAAAAQATELRQAFAELSKDTGRSQVELAKAAQAAAEGGATSVTDLQQRLTAATQAAEATGGDLTSIIGGLSQVLRLFGLSGADAERVLAKIFVTAQGKTSLQDLLDAFTKLAPVVAQSHISFDVASGALATLISRGYDTKNAMALLKSLPTEGIEQLARASTVASTGLAEMQKAGAENAETLEHQAAVLKQNYNAALTELGVHIVPLAVQELQGLNGILALLDGTLDKIRSGSSIATVLTLGNRELKEGSDAAERLQDALRQLADQARSGDLNLTGLTGAQLESLSKTVDKFTTPGTAGFLAPLRAAIDAQGSRGVGPAALPVITVVADPAAIKAREEFAKETERVLKSISESLKGAAVTALDDFLAEYRKIADSLTQEQRQAAEQAIAGLRAKVLEEQAKNPELITRPAPVAIRAEGLDRLDQTLSDEEKHQKAIADAAEREARARAEALQHAATLGRQIEQVARGAIGLAQAFGLADSASSAVLQNVVSLAGALPEAIKGLEALNKGGADLQAIGGIAGALAPVVGVIGGIAGLIAGLTAEDPNVALLRETNEKLRLAVDNLAKHFDSFAINLTGNQQIKAQGAVTELLSGKRLPGDTSFHGLGSFLSGGSANGINLTDLQQVAKEVLGQALDTSNIERFTAGLKALQDALALADRTRFADSFTGQLEALNARFQLLNITDPVEKLKELLAVIADVPRTVTIALPNGKTETRQIGHGSPAIANALAGLDLGNAGDRAKALDKLTALLDQLTSGQLDAKARGDLTPDQFKQELLDLGGLLRDANQQVGGQSQSFAIDRTITEITGSRIAALLDTSLVYQSTLPEIRDLLAAAFGGGLITAPILPASQTVAGPSIIIQAGAFPLTVVVPPGADGQAIGQAAAAAQAQALDELLAQRARLKQTAAGGVVQ